MKVYTHPCGASDRYVDLLEEGEDAWLNGQSCPYEEGSEEAKIWHRGWRSVDLRAECKADAEGE